MKTMLTRLTWTKKHVLKVNDKISRSSFKFSVSSFLPIDYEEQARNEKNVLHGNGEPG